MRLRNCTLIVIASMLVVPARLYANAAATGSAAEAAEKAASELNHHIAGIALIAIAGLVIGGQLSHRLRHLGLLWPILFIAMGLFLAAWSDVEIWPRGPLPWTWMIDHDGEARQHKIYAMLLIAIGIIEFLAARGKLSLQWRRWSFPVLALVGAALLTMHSHGGTSGLPQGWKPSDGVPVGPLVAGLQPVQAQNAASAEPASAAVGHHHHNKEDVTMSLPGPAGASNHQHQHKMTPEMLRIQREHLWMTIVGIVVAFSKFLADGRFFQSKSVPYIWPQALGILGVLLLLYRE